MTQQASERLSDARVQALQLMACDRLDEVLDALAVRLSRSYRRYTGPCPVHGGDNRRALLLFPEGDSAPGYWRCQTAGCHHTFRPTLLGFVRGVLSHQKHGWSGRGDREVGFREAVAWLCSVLGVRLNDIDVSADSEEMRRFVARAATLSRSPRLDVAGYSREVVRRNLQLPSPYYLTRGYRGKVLDRYDVGDCHNPSSRMFQRAVVPVYDDEGKRVVGVTGRSLHEECRDCRCHHDPAHDCPADPAHVQFVKWRNSPDLHRDSHLYNLWFARTFIRESGVAVIVEGPGDVWRLVEAGVYNGIALFGAALSDEQQVLLELSGALSVVVLTDTDGTGQKAAEELDAKLSSGWRVLRPSWPAHDVASLPAVTVKELLTPVLAQAGRGLS